MISNCEQVRNFENFAKIFHCALNRFVFLLQNSTRVLNKVSASAPVKRGKEREQPKARKPTMTRKVYLCFYLTFSLFVIFIRILSRFVFHPEVNIDKIIHVVSQNSCHDNATCGKWFIF